MRHSLGSYQLCINMIHHYVELLFISIHANGYNLISYIICQVEPLGELFALNYFWEFDVSCKSLILTVWHH